MTSQKSFYKNVSTILLRQSVFENFSRENINKKQKSVISRAPKCFFLNSFYSYHFMVFLLALKILCSKSDKQRNKKSILCMQNSTNGENEL